RGKATYSYLVINGDCAEGYIVYTQGGQQDPIEIVDYSALSPVAGLRLLTFLRDNRSMSPTVNWYGGPADFLAGLCTEQTAKITSSMDWMVRIVDVEKALAARSYAC